MYERGEKLWLALAFYELPLRAVAHVVPEEGHALSQSTESGPLRAIAQEGKEEGHTPCPGSHINPLGASANEAAPEALHHLLGKVEKGAAVAGEHPVAVLEKQRVLLANEPAVALGVAPGQSAATARTLVEGITLLERDPAAEQRCLQQLCCWAYSITPTLFPHGDHFLLLEIGSCMRLYGSVEALLTRIRRELSHRGHACRYGLGPTPGAAALFADHASTEPLDTTTGESAAEGRSHTDSHNPEGTSLEARLGPLPLKLPGEFPREVDALARAGLWRFADILALPRQALARRCGKEFAHYLEQVLGTAEDLHPDFLPPQEFIDHYWFGYEVKANQELLPAVELLLQSLCRFLRNTQLQSQCQDWLLYGINRRIHRFQVLSSEPHTDWRAWYRLAQLKVEQLELDESIEGVGLECRDLVPGNTGSGDLFQQAGQKEPLHSLLDRLKSRLGLQSVRKIACRDEHLPEFAGYCSLDTRPGSLPTDDNGELRPFWLMNEPQRLAEHDGLPCWNGRLILLEGPERIEDNWWDRAVSRDYYIARDGAGQQYWIYRDRLQDSWFLQGVFH